VTLTRYDSALVHQPYLARSWRWSPDRRQLVLSLVSGLAWHDGHLISCDAGLHPGWQGLQSPTAGQIFSIEIV